MVGARHPTMAATLLAIRVEVADFDRLAVAILPLNLYFGLVNHDFPPSLAILTKGVSHPAGAYLSEICMSTSKMA